MATAVTSTIVLLQILIFKYTPSASALTHCSARATSMTKTVLSVNNSVKRQISLTHNDLKYTDYNAIQKTI